MYIVVTDLDGTLLDHDSYSYAPAQPALDFLFAKRIPLVLCCPVNAAEILRIREEIGLTSPFVLENGAAISGFSHCNEAIWQAHTHRTLVLAAPRAEILRKLAQIKNRHRFRYKGFSEMSCREIATLTGLPVHQAKLAMEREFTEPLQWLDSEGARQEFLQQLIQNGLTAEQGGRFLNISSGCCKGSAVNRLREIATTAGTTPIIIALGDAPNDTSMLNAADIAVVIDSGSTAKPQVSKPQRILRPTKPGPAGWNEAIMDIMNARN